MIVSFLVFPSSCTVSVSRKSLFYFCLFGTLFLCARLSSDIQAFLIVCSYLGWLEALYMCFGIWCWLWASRQYHLTGLFFFFFLENPMLCTFIFPLVLIAFPKEESFGLPPADTWRVWAWLLDLVGQSSHHSVYKLPLNAPIFVVKPSPNPELSLVLLTLCFIVSKDYTSLWGEE